MVTHLILTLISDDKPGIVQHIAQCVAENNGNWLESRLAQLAGKFAGVVRISTPEENLPTLKQALQALESEDLHLVVETVTGARSNTPHQTAKFSAVGPDRPGIIREISQALAGYQINVEDLVTNCSSMPYSGEPIFEARGTLSVAGETDWDSLQDQLHNIAEHLAMDIHLERS